MAKSKVSSPAPSHRNIALSEIDKPLAGTIQEAKQIANWRAAFLEVLLGDSRVQDLFRQLAEDLRHD